MRNLKFILLGLLFLASTGAFAQARFGLKVGGNLSTLRVNEDNVSNEDMRPGISFGAMARVPVINKVLSIQPEVLYSERGAEYAGELGGELKLRSTYLDVPVLAMVHLGKYFNVFAGPQVSWLFNAKEVRSGSFLGLANGTNEITKSFNNVDYGAVGGVGIDIKPLTLSLRYNMGFREVYKDSGEIPGRFRYNNAKNQVIQLQVGILF